jgi:hypothetical protein
MVNSHVTPQNTVVTQQRTVANEGDVNVLPYEIGECRATTQPRSRQLLPTPQVPPLAREG